MSTAYPPAARRVTLDERRRTSLAKVGRKEHNEYLVEEQEGGVLVFTPAVTVSAIEAAVLRDPELRDSIVRAANTPRSEYRTRTRPQGA